MTRKIIKLILTIAIAMTTLSVSGLTCFAVPAMPGVSGGNEGLCCSATAEEPVTLEVLAERDRLKSEKEKVMKVSSAAGDMGVKSTEGDLERSLPLLCIVVGFKGTTEDAPKGLPYSEDYNWGDSIFSGNASITKFYKDMSLGQFTFVPAAESSRYGERGNTNKYDKVNDGIIHVTVDMPHLAWAADNALISEELQKVYIEAIKKTEPYINYGDYDFDGDGMIANSELAITFILAGYDASVDLDLTMGVYNYIWPHAYFFSKIEEARCLVSYPEANGIRINGYITMAETFVIDGKTEQAKPSTLCHELGHYLGLPDLYNTSRIAGNEWFEYQVGIMSLMDRGCWGKAADGSYTVYSLDMWSRYILGWIDAELITESGTYIVSGEDYSVETDHPRLYKINGAVEGEYYLIENHRMSNWDKDMAYGLKYMLQNDSYSSDGGIIIWHIDQGIIDNLRLGDSPNDLIHRPGMMPIYPEQTASGTYMPISDIAGGKVVRDPFINSNQYGQNMCDLSLPCFGWNQDKDTRLARFYSNIQISVLDSSKQDMKFKVTMKSNTWVKEKDGWRYLNEEGQYRYGWIKDKGKWYYLDVDNALMRTGWINDMGKWYYLTGSGAMKTGWLLDNGKWYYLTGSGAMKTGWLLDKGKWYYLTGSGAMKTGWLKSGGKWYYLTGSGAMKTGWLLNEGKWYYLNSSGAMVTGTQTINGKTYKFSESGECLNP